jgi:hypothetical protein
MRPTKFSWTFPLLFIIVFLGIYLALRYYKEGLTTAPPQNSSVVNSINYTLGGQPYKMDAPPRVWTDPHQSSDGTTVNWLWEEVPPTLVQLNAISQDHVGQTLTLDLTNNQYIWSESQEKGVITSTS